MANKATDDLCQKVAGEEREGRGLRDSLEEARLQLTPRVTCKGYCLSDSFNNLTIYSRSAQVLSEFHRRPIKRDRKEM